MEFTGLRDTNGMRRVFAAASDLGIDRVPRRVSEVAPATRSAQDGADSLREIVECHADTVMLSSG
jgi:hypothetical protein